MKAALEEELVHIQNVFCEFNDYPQKLVETIIENEQTSYMLQQEAESTPRATQVEESHEETEEEIPVELTLHLPYKGEVGSVIVSKLQKSILNTVNKNWKKVKVGTVYKATRLGSGFNLKDRIAFENQQNIVYHGGCPNKVSIELCRPDEMSNGETWWSTCNR